MDCAVLTLDGEESARSRYLAAHMIGRLAGLSSPIHFGPPAELEHSKIFAPKTSEMIAESLMTMLSAGLWHFAQLTCRPAGMHGTSH